MNKLTEAEVAWLAGIYEGEGYCGISSKRAIHVSIVMTDFDVMERILALTGIGSLRPGKHANNPEHKSFLRWGVGSKNAVDFLELILPWLGERRSARASAAVENWTNNRIQAGPNDSECIHGHSYDPPNKRMPDGSCQACRIETGIRWKENNRELINARARAATKARRETRLSSTA